MTRKRPLAGIALCVFGIAIHASGAEINHALAKQYFAEVRELCAADGGKLWGHSLCGPVMLADGQSREVVANQADGEGLLRAEDGVFTGQLPAHVGVANTSTEWAGTLWTQLLWPLPQDDAVRRRVLLAHESFHRLQKEVPQRIPGTGGEIANSLDTVQGRYLLQMEWRALASALHAAVDHRRQFVADALVFRERRHELFPDDRQREQHQEANEGLAEYTGVKLGGANVAKQMELAIAGLSAAARKPSFVRSFAYGSGPAYGLLLDEAQPGWRKDELTNPQDLGFLLQRAMKIELPKNLAETVNQRSNQYGGTTLMAAEKGREKERDERVAAFRKLLVDGPVLRIALQRMGIEFNPNNLLPIEGLGTVYPTLRITDAWGVLEVTKGALLASDWKSVTVPAPGQFGETKIEGDGWVLDLKAGWKVKAAERAGDFELAKP